MTTLHRRVSLLFVLVSLAACSSGSKNADAGASPLEIQPATAEIAPGEAVKFAATLDGAPDAPVVWAVAEDSGGAVDATGHYVAPDAEGTYHVVARIDGTALDAATAVIQVKRRPSGGITVAVSPAAASVAAGGSLVFTGDVTGTSSTAVTWSVQEGAAGGTVADGTYTAPQSAGTYHVVATSAVDATKSATATVTVTAPPADATSVDVTAYGAKGDGVTDDTAAFNAAAATGKNLRVPATAAHYKITGTIRISTSITGVGMPEIRMYGADGSERYSMIAVLDYTGTGLTISGLHLNGQWTGGSNGEWSHNVLVKGSKNVTIENNLLENPYGDNVLLGGENDPTPSSSVIVRNNQLLNPRRCNIALVSVRDTTITQNVMKKSNDYVSAIDMEPNPTPNDSDWGVTVTGNQFTSPNAVSVLLYHFDYGYPSDGLAGGNISITGNTGSAMRFFAQVGNWSNVTQSSNF